MSAVCAFRLSAIDAVFDHGRFTASAKPGQLSTPKFLASHERPGKCQPADARRTASPDFSSVRNPLMWESVHSEGHRPLIVDGPGRAEIISVAVLPLVPAVREGQKHDVLFLGRMDGHVMKLVRTQQHGSNQSSTLVETVRVLSTAVTSLQVALSQQALLVVGEESVARLPVEHCSMQQTCSMCVRLRDHHCAWDVDVRRCVHRRWVIHCTCCFTHSK